MSKFTENRSVETCQEKLPPPRSLRGVGEDSEMIWNVIVERYPKAAPLLCEMETAIERAENLLHKFRTAPYTDVREIERSSSSDTSNSDESITMLTANSGTQLSMSEDNDDVEEVGTRMSDNSMSKNEDHVTSWSWSNSDDPFDNHVYANPSIQPLAVEESINIDAIQDSMSEKNTHKKEDSSSEKREYVVDDKVLNTTKININKYLSIVSSDRCDNPDEICEKSSTKEPMMEMKKEEVIGTKGLASKVISKAGELESTVTKIPKAEIIAGSKKRSGTRSDSSPVKNTMTNFMPIVADNGGESNPESSFKETAALKILENYAKQCNEKLEFKVSQNKTNSCKIECSFASYNANSVGYPESSVKNDVAVLILRMLAEHQMDEEKDMKNLIPFSNKQMRDVVALGTGGQPENAMRKLYKLCLEKNAPKPVYKIKMEYVPEGVKNIAECSALNKEATGVGIREEVAKKMAAEKLYTQLLSELSSQEVLKNAQSKTEDCR